MSLSLSSLFQTQSIVAVEVGTKRRCVKLSNAEYGFSLTDSMISAMYPSLGDNS
jgi:hypothetical protein